MRSTQYQRLEILLAQAEAITLEHPLLTPQGKAIQADIRRTLTTIVAEKYRAELREGVLPTARTQPPPGQR